MSLVRIRREYESHGIDVADLDPDPVVQARRWIDDAVEAACIEPTAMTVATVDSEGRPQSRYVLLRGLDERGFWFFTNSESEKGRALAGNPHAALTLAWLQLHRQLRVGGVVEALPDELSDAYFARRSRGSQIGAWASRQSTVIESRASAPSPSRPSASKAPTSRARPTGAATPCSRTRSSSGRDARAACTIASCFGATATAGPRCA